MKQLANRWAGRIYGTNTGNIFLDLKQDGTSVSGQLRIMDTVYGVSVYKYTGTADEQIVLCCEPIQFDTTTTIEYGQVTVKGKLTEQGTIKGEWHTTIGTAGTFEIYPHNLNFENEPNNSKPEQIHNKSINVGSIRLFKDDLINLISFIKKDFSSGRVVVTYFHRGTEQTKYAEDFLSDCSDIEKLNYIKLVIQEPEAYNINRLVVVELTTHNGSDIRVSGINESWVLGKSLSIYEFIKPKQNLLITTYKKHGLNLNFFIFLIMIIAMPDINNVLSRIAFTLSVIILLNILLFIHNKIIPNTAIYMQQTRPNLFIRLWPTILSWLIAATSSIAASYIYAIFAR